MKHVILGAGPAGVRAGWRGSFRRGHSMNNHSTAGEAHRWCYARLCYALVIAVALWSAPGKAEEVGWKKGKYFPDIVYENAGGKTSLHQQRGKVVLVNFWAAWCNYCRREWRSLQKSYNEFKQNESVQFVILNVFEDYATGAEWVRKKQYTVPIFDSRYEKRHPDNPGKEAFTDASGAYIDYDPGIIPRTYILNKEGKITKTFRSKITKRWIRNAINKALRDS